jgi:hypothetical protein
MEVIFLIKSKCEAPRPYKGGASRKGNFVHIVPLDPAYKAGLAGHVPVKLQMSKECQNGFTPNVFYFDLF